MEIITLFFTSFLVGFSGASTPGPLMTLVLAQSSIGGWKKSLEIISGHAILEGILLILLLFGLQPVLEHPVFLRSFTLLGSVFLIYMGITLFISILNNRIEIKNSDPVKIPLTLAGALTSLGNPYWLLWWITIGVSFITQAKSLLLPGILSFYTGHILADYTWYIFIGILGQGLSLPFWGKVYRYVLYFSSLFLFGFGLYFIYYAIFKIS
ncbi:MAG: LysE family transporter [Dictyoglomi bacterium]|nr:LysE family transporter [Dictyoglomota bacterium]